MAQFQRGTVKCIYCGYLASSIHKLLNRHSCNSKIRSRQVTQQSLANPYHHGYRSTELLPESTSLSPWISEKIKVSEIPIFERLKRSKLLNRRQNIGRHELLHRRQNVERSKSSPQRVLLPDPIYQRFEEPIRPQTLHYTERRIYPVNHTETISMNTTSNSELVLKPHVLLVASIDKKIVLISLDDAMNEIEKRIQRLPYETRLQLEYEFLQHVKDAGSKEQQRTMKSV